MHIQMSQGRFCLVGPGAIFSVEKLGDKAVQALKKHVKYDMVIVLAH